MAKTYLDLVNDMWQYILDNSLTITQVQNATAIQIKDALSLSEEDVRVLGRCKQGIKKELVRRYNARIEQSEYNLLVDSLQGTIPSARERTGAALLIMADRAQQAGKECYLDLSPLKEAVGKWL